MQLPRVACNELAVNWVPGLTANSSVHNLRDDSFRGCRFDVRIAGVNGRLKESNGHGLIKKRKCYVARSQ